MSAETDDLIDRVEEIRERRGLSKADFCREIGKSDSYPTVFLWLTKQREPRLEGYLVLKEWVEKHGAKKK